MRLKPTTGFWPSLRWEWEYGPLRTGPNVGDSRACDGCKSPYCWYGYNTATLWVYTAFWFFEWIYCSDCARRLFPEEYQVIMESEDY